jgi:2-(1,2-epoxy-1,2-dihydrophenyl)acetyl-CoA isomerase
MQDQPPVTYEASGTIAWIRLNRPQALNAIDTDLRAALLVALKKAERDSDVKVVLLGAVGRAFCAGADLMEDKAEDFSVEDELLQGYRPVLEKIARMPQTVIGVAPGVAAGVGAALLMTCDLVMMAEDARIYMAFSHIGLVPDGGATWLLYQHLGYQRAFELIVEGGSLDAKACLAAGIANKLVEADGLEAAATEWAKELATRSAVSTAEAKKLLRAAATSTLAQAIESETAAQARCIDSEESRAAVAEFKNRSGRK